MITGVLHTALLVHDYDEAIEFYCKILGFILVEDTTLEKKRWVRIRAPGGQGSDLLLSKTVNAEQASIIGNQAGGRVLFYLQTDDLAADFLRFSSLGVVFTEAPQVYTYGKVAVFKDLYGNRIDLIEPAIQ